MNFCGACGASLHPTPIPRRERRLVSVLFCDLVGFTTFSETRDPEDVRDVFGEYFAAARRIVGDYGGTIEKFIGDAVMALWGAPIAREDDAARAVRAGLEIVQAVMALAQRLSIPALRVRVGVLTGEAAVEVGSQEEGMVTGDAVNTAARIQSIADPETVLVDDVTRLACERVIAFDDAGLHSVKGRRARFRCGGRSASEMTPTCPARPRSCRRWLGAISSWTRWPAPCAGCWGRMPVVQYRRSRHR